MSASTSVRLARRMAETGSLAPARQDRPPGGGKLAPYRDLLVGWVKRDGEITMPELAARLAHERQVMVHPASLSRFLKAAGSPSKTLLASVQQPRRSPSPPDLRSPDHAYDVVQRLLPYSRALAQARGSPVWDMPHVIRGFQKAATPPPFLLTRESVLAKRIRGSSAAGRMLFRYDLALALRPE